MFSKKSNAIFLLPLVILLLHSADELLTGFPAWATGHFGTTTVTFFIYTHIFLLVIVGLIVYFALIRGTLWKFVAVIVMAQFATNALFHIATSFLFQEITPGIVTALIVSLPFSFFFFRILWKEKFLAKPQIILAIAAGAILALIIIASLWFDGRV